MHLPFDLGIPFLDIHPTGEPMPVQNDTCKGYSIHWRIACNYKSLEIIRFPTTGGQLD